MIVWIVLLVQHSGIIESFRPLPHNFTSNLNLMSVQDIKDKLSLTLPKEFFKRTEGLHRDREEPENEFAMLRHHKSSWKGDLICLSFPHRYQSKAANPLSLTHTTLGWKNPHVPIFFLRFADSTLDSAVRLLQHVVMGPVHHGSAGDSSRYTDRALGSAQV